jgi:hypothetical protein
MLPRATRQSVDRREHRVKRRHHMGFRSPQRREPQLGQFLLEGTDIAMPQRDVMREVEGAFQIGWVDALSPGLKGALRLGKRPPDLS